MRKYSRLMVVLLAVAMILPGVAQAAPVAEVEDLVTRISGDDRVETAVEASKVIYPDGAENVVIAGYSGEVDALTGTLLANAKDAPLLLTTQGKLSDATKAELERLGAENVFILGGPKVVSEAVIAELSDYTVERVSGTDRDLTAQAAAEAAGVQQKRVFLANGYANDYADALAVGPASAKQKMPVLLTKTNEVPKNTKATMEAFGVSHITIVGGTSAVSAELETALKEDYTVDRVYGSDREGTAVAIANKYFAGSDKAVIAKGYGIVADALVGGYVGAKQNAPILLTNTNRMTATTKTFIEENTEQAWILGGKTVVSEKIEDEVEEAIIGDQVLAVSAINKTVTVGEEYVLPTTVMVTIEGEEEPVQMDVTWDNDVVTEEAGIFEFVGTLVLPEGYVNTNDVVVNLTLTVEEAAPTTEELATAAVVKAEETKTQEDVDAATALVVALEDETVKAELQGRLDVVQAEIDAAAEAALEEAKTTAKAELAGYVVAEDYTTNAEALTTALTAGETAIDEATTEEEVATALADAKLAIDEIKTDAELAEEALQAATDAVAKAEAGLLEARGTVEKDLADAKALVAELDQTASEVILLNHRLSLVDSQVTKIITDVNTAVAATNQIALDTALQAKVFDGYNVELIATYMTDLNGATTDTIVKIQEVIDTTNLTPGVVADAKLVTDAVKAVDAAVKNPEADVTPPVTPAKSLIEAAQEAIDALPVVSEKVITVIANSVNTELTRLDIELTATIGEDLQKSLNGAKAVKAVIKANNQITLKAALNSAEFERVNNDLILEYAKGKASTTVGIVLNPAGDNDIIPTTSSATSVKTVAAVQTVIDTVNLAQATAAVTAADTTAATALTAPAINKAQALVSALPDKTVAEKATKKGLQDRIDKAVAVANVKNATTEANLLAALKAEVLALTDIDDASVKYYKAEFDKGTGKAAITNVTYDLQATIVNAGNTAAIADYVTKVDAITVTTSLEDVKALLTELKRLDGTNFTGKINDLLLEEYRTDLVAGTITDTASINTIIVTANNPSGALTTLVDAGSALDDADKLLTALKAKTLNLTVTDANKAAYFADIADIKTAAGTGADNAAKIANVQAVVNATNARVELNAATTKEAAKTALTKFAIATTDSTYINLSSAAKAEVAALVLAKRPAAGYTTNADVTTEISTQNTARTTLITAVNDAGPSKPGSTITKMNAALTALKYAPYVALSPAEKVAVAEAFLVAFPMNDATSPVQVDYTTITAIQVAIDTAIAAQ